MDQSYIQPQRRRSFFNFTKRNSFGGENKFSGFANKIKTSKILNKKTALVVLVVLVGGILYWVTAQSLAGNSTQKYEVAGAKAVKPIAQEILFPLTDETGAELTKIKYYIENAELRDEIIVQGKKATSVKGRVFLILNVKLSNDYDKPIEINTRDYVRLVVNDNESELLAADIHNDPVAIQAISTKYTRLGFPINETDKNLKLKVGEINGEKQTIDISF